MLESIGKLRGMALLLLLMVTVAMVTYGESGEPPEEGGTLVIAYTSEATALDPHYGTGAYSDRAMKFTHERLTYVDNNGMIKPRLAKSWEALDGGKTWDFFLREDIKFSDGSKLTAGVVAWYFNFALDPENGCIWRSDIAPIIERVEALDELTVRFYLKAPHGLLPSTLAGWMVGPGIKSKESWDKLGKEASLETPVGTGPFILEEWRRGDRLIFVRNPNYWQSGLPYLDRIVLRIMPESAVQVQALLRGEIDISDSVPRHMLQELRDNPELHIESARGWQQEILWMNNRKPPFDDRRVRLAIAKAIDRQAIISMLFFGTAIRGTAGIPSWHWAAADGLDEVASYDPEVAKALLSEAGYPEGFRTTLVTNLRRPEFKAEAELIQAQLAEIGVEVDVRVMETGAWWDYVLAEPWEYELLLSEYSLSPDPHELLWLNLQSSNQYALSRPENEEFDRLLDEGRESVDKEQRTDIYIRLQKIVDYEVPLIFILHRDIIWVMRDRVKDFHGTGAGYIVPTEIWVQQE